MSNFKVGDIVRFKKGTASFTHWPSQIALIVSFEEAQRRDNHYRDANSQYYLITHNTDDPALVGNVYYLNGIDQEMELHPIHMVKIEFNKDLEEIINE